MLTISIHVDTDVDIDITLCILRKAQATELDFLACLDSLDRVINGYRTTSLPTSPETDCSGDPTREKWDDATKECGNQDKDWWFKLLINLLSFGMYWSDS